MKKLCELISKKTSDQDTSKNCFFSKLWAKLTGKSCQTTDNAPISTPTDSSTEEVQSPTVEATPEPVQETTPTPTLEEPISQPEEPAVEVATEPESAEPVIAEVSVKSEPEPVAVKAVITNSCKTFSPSIPQEATLRRHYLTHLKMMIMAVQGERPTDSTLRRHYDALIEAKLDDCIHCSTMHATMIACYEQSK